MIEKNLLEEIRDALTPQPGDPVQPKAMALAHFNEHGEIFSVSGMPIFEDTIAKMNAQGHMNVCAIELGEDVYTKKWDGKKLVPMPPLNLKPKIKGEQVSIAGVPKGAWVSIQRGALMLWSGETTDDKPLTFTVNEAGKYDIAVKVPGFLGYSLVVENQ